jgi:hypothetical protein
MAEVDVFLSDGRYDDAKALLAERLDKNPLDRESKLYLLLVNVILNGPAVYEDDIDQLRSLSDFSDIEKEIVRRLFILGFESAKKEVREDQAWAYQRLSRRLLLNQRLDQPIPKSAARALRMNQRHAPELVDGVLGPGYENDAERRSDRTISAQRLIAVCKQTCIVWLNRCHRAFQTSSNLATWTAKISRQTTLITSTVGLLITPMLYLLSVHRQMTAGVPGSIRVVPPPSTADDSVPAVDVTALSENAEARTTGAQAKAKLPLRIPSSTVVEERKWSVNHGKQLAELKPPKMVVTAATDRTKSEEPPTDAIDYETLRIVPLRQEPHFAAATTEDIDSGTVISVLETIGDWLKIKTRPSGSVGYVRKEYVAPASRPQ